MTLQMPKRDASGLILRRNSDGSRHSSSVGQYVGASSRPCGRSFLTTGSRTAVGWPRRSTEVSSRGALDRELRGVCGFMGW